MVYKFYLMALLNHKCPGTNCGGTCLNDHTHVIRDYTVISRDRVEKDKGEGEIG